MGFLIAAAVAVGAWFLITRENGAASSSTSTTTSLPLSSGSAPAVTTDPTPGSLDRFLGPPVRIPSPMQRAIAPEVLTKPPGVIAQLQQDTAAQRLARFYGPEYPMRYARNLE